MLGKIQVVVGGQFGSEGKGHACAELAKRELDMLAIRTGGPNAGHTVWGSAGSGQTREFKLRQVPVATVVNPGAMAVMAPRSVIQLDLLEREAKEVGITVRVDRAATLLEPAHIVVEQGDDSLAGWSTQKGIGAARADRIHRTARCFGQLERMPPGLVSTDASDLIQGYLDAGSTVQIEAAQGYGLGLHTSYYPKTTSADCRAIDALADVGLSPWGVPQAELEIWVVVRPYPIRVAGQSGPLRLETTWEALGLPEERTTVTNKVRRVGGWDPSLVADAVQANGGSMVKLWMNMADHVFPFLKDQTSFDGLTKTQHQQVLRWLTQVHNQTDAQVHALGTGPDTAIFVNEQ